MKKIRILIVDDTPSMRSFVKAGIMSSFSGDVEVEEAGSGEIAMQKLAARPCDIVLSDWNLPGIKGTELLTWMKEQDNLKDIPFLMLTAYNDKDTVASAIDAGVSDFIMKPISADALNKRLMVAIRTVLNARSYNAGEKRPAED